MTFIIGTDPGKYGAHIVRDPEGEIIYSATMPYSGSELDHHELARIYREIDSCVREADLGASVVHYIEKIYTRPEDTGSSTYLKALEHCAKTLSNIVHIYEQAEVFNKQAVDEHTFLGAKQLAYARAMYQNRGRTDGRVGVLNYAKASGKLYMGAALGWRIEEVNPRTWHAKIRKDVKGSNSKEKSWNLLEELGYYGHHALDAKRKERREGLCEAFLISEYGRVDQGLEIV